MVISRHGLWETFLQIKLNFSWDEVHDLAEELEHIYSEKLINRLDQFLDFPSFDPHGDAIPNSDGEIFIPFRQILSEAKVGDVVKIIAVKDNTKEFLNYVDKIGVVINDKIIIESKDNFNCLTTINIKGKLHVVSPRFTDNVFIVSPRCEKIKD